MPELAEVETIARQLANTIGGQQLHRVDVHYPLWIQHGEIDSVIDARIVIVRRWGKRLVWEFESGEWCVFSLGMTGQVRLEASGNPRHLMATFSFENYSVHCYDARRFGNCLVFLDAHAAHAKLASRIGVDAAAALSLTTWKQAFRGTTVAIKAALLDQSRVGGIGNYLADEILFDAQIHPKAPTQLLSHEEWKRLNRARRTVIQRALRHQGLSFSDYVDTTGARGTLIEQLRVYGHAGHPCPCCGGILAKTRVAGRGTTYCPRCQLLPSSAR